MRSEILHVVFGGVVGISAGKLYPLDGLSEYTGGYPRYARQFVCPFCCKVWGTLQNPNHRYHRPEAVSCLNCATPTDFSPVPGSVLQYSITPEMIDLELLNHLPESIIKKEFDLHMRYLACPPTADTTTSETAQLDSTKSKTDILLESL